MEARRSESNKGSKEMAAIARVEDLMSAYKEVSEWLEREATEPGNSTGASVDIDELLDPPPANPLRSLVESVSRHVTALDRRGTRLVLVVAEISNLVDERPAGDADVSRLVSARWSYGPGYQVPTLYLVEPEYWSQSEGSEYRRYFSVDSYPGLTSLYYREWDLDEATEDRSRALYFVWRV